MSRTYLTAAVLAVAASGWILSGQIGNSEQITKDAKQTVKAIDTASPKAPLPEIRVRTFTAIDHVNELVLFGRTESDRVVHLRSETAGRVAQLLVSRGDSVHAGTVLVKLGMEDRKARLIKAQALVDQQQIAYKAAVELSKKEYRSKVKLAESKAGLESARAALARIELDIRRTVIRAPFDGVVNDNDVEVGSYVKVGDNVLTIMDLNPILIIGEIAERDIGGVRKGVTADIRLADGRNLTGRVRYVSMVGAKSTRTFRIEIVVENPDLSIPEGLTTEIRLAVGQFRAHLISPAVLTLSDAGVIGVKLVDQNNIIHFVAITPIADSAEGVWITGLPDSVVLVTVGQEFVIDGQRVNPQFEDKKAAS